MLRTTGNELDFALEDGFFQVETPDGTIYSTRDGRFGRDANGDLVTSQGHFVLDENGQHINLPSTRVEVAVDGAILDQGVEIARLGILDFTPNQLIRAGEAYFQTTGEGQPPIGGPGLRQGLLEGSNSILVEEMTSLLAVQRTYQANQRVLAVLDGTLDQAAGQLGTL
jgi:flagellar basal-body rod protein FlgG